MTDALLAIAIVLLFAVLAFLAALYKRQGRGGTAVEAELRGRIGELESEAGALRARVEAEQGARVTAETRLESERRNLEEQRALLDEAEQKLKDAFAALSAEALKNGREQFIAQAEQRLKPIQEALKTYEEHLVEIEKIRSDAYGGLKTHLDTLAQAHQSLQKEAHQLSTALRSPTVRGRWGEMTLRRVVEAAGMSPHVDFEEQVSVTTEEGRLRPDLLIRLPGDRTVVVDSKVPLAAYMDATEAKEEEGRLAALGRHAQDVRKHVRALSQKAYWDQFARSPDFVVLFLPGESFFSAALEQDRSLMEDAMRSKVFLATPTTLMALLNVVAHGWRQQEMAENAERIAEAGRDLFERLRVFAEHFGKVGEGLRRAVNAYDQAVGSYESRLQPGARRLAELGASSGKELPEVPTVEGPTRSLPEAGAGEAEE